MTPTLKSHIEFCRAVSNGSTYKDAYKTYVSRKVDVSDAVCEKDGSLLGKKYAAYIADLKKKDADDIMQARSEEVVKKALNEVLSVLEVDAILCKEVQKGDTKAIDIFYKRFGAYPATKVENEITISEKAVMKLPDGTEIEI